MAGNSKPIVQPLEHTRPPSFPKGGNRLSWVRTMECRTPFQGNRKGKVENFIQNCLLQEITRMKQTAWWGAGSRKSKATLAGKVAKQAHALGKLAEGVAQAQHPDITVPHPWGQTLEGSRIEGGLGLLTLWKLDTTKNTWDY